MVTKKLDLQEITGYSANYSSLGFTREYIAPEIYLFEAESLEK